MKAIARVKISQELSSDDGGIRPTVFLPSSKPVNVDGKVHKLVFKDNLNRPVNMSIEGVREFDREDPIDLHNWKTLNTLLQLPDMTELKEMIELVDPDKEEREALEREALEQELRTLIFQHKEDIEWLGKVYRRVVGPASGIPVGTLAKALLDRAKSYNAEKKTYGLYDFILGKKWVFEDEYFETRALLDMCIERGLIITDGAFYKLRDDGKVIGHDESKTLYTLQNDHVLRAFLNERLGKKEKEAEESFSKPQIINPDLAALIGEIGEPESTEAGTDAVRSETEAIVDNLISNGIIEAAGDEHTLTDIQQRFATKLELIEFLDQNEELRKQYEALI